MNKRKLTDFFDKEFKQFSANKNYQSIASYIDGLKPTARKVMHTVIKNKLDAWTKVEVLANKTAGETEYLGGASNISGVIVTYSKTYVGSNNLQMLDTNGNFGQRLDTKPGEPRYIKVRKDKRTDSLFNKMDNKILIEQEFEETIIEPRFFVPTLPILLINGSEGMGSGHAHVVLPRSIDNVKDYLKSSLTGNSLPLLPPFWNGFKGKVYQGDAKNKWVTEGLYEVNRRTITITELPIGYSLKSYIKKLDALEDKKAIRSYIDESDTKKDNFRFKIMVDTKFDLSHDNIIDKLALTSKFAENYTTIDENNSIRIFETPEEIVEAYIKIKLEYMQKRKDYIIEDISKDLLNLKGKYLFIKAVTEDKIKVNKTKKVDIIKQIDDFKTINKVNDSYDYLLTMPIYSLTSERMDALVEQLKTKKKELDEVKSKETSEMWLDEID